MFCLGIGEGKAQFNKYHTFPDSNANWCENIWWQATGCFSEYVTAFRYYDYYVNGDTIVNGKTYNKVRTSGGYETAPPCPPPIVWLDYDNLECLIREDSVAQKVYGSFSPTFGHDTLLYDFSLHVGDYLPAGYLTTKGDSTYVCGIDSILIGGTYRKQLIIAQNKSTPFIFDSMIQGIGNMFGLLGRIMPPFESGSNLNGFNNLNIYFPNGDTCNRFILSSPEVQNPEFHLIIFPNPTTSIFTLHFVGAQNFEPESIEIYNVLGEKVNFGMLKQVQHDCEIDLSSQPTGIYFYRVISESGNLLGEGKIVKN